MSIRRARFSGFFRICASAFHFSQDDSRLGTAQEFIAAEGDHVHPRGERVADGGLPLQAVAVQFDQAAAPQVIHDGKAVFLTQGDERKEIRLLGKTHDPEVARVDLEDHSRLRTDRPFVVGKSGPVRRPHFFQVRTAFFHHIGNAELPPDLDQFTAGDDRLLPLGQAIQDQKDGGGVIVDDQPILRPGQGAEELTDMVIAKPPLPLLQVVLQVGVPPGDFVHPLQRFPAERRPAKVGMENDSGGVDHPPETIPAEAVEDLLRLFRRCFLRRQAQLPAFSLIGQDPVAERFHDGPARLLHQLPRHPDNALPLFNQKHHLIDLRQVLQQFFFMFVHYPPLLFMAQSGDASFKLEKPQPTSLGSVKSDR